MLGSRKTPIKNCDMCNSQLVGYRPHDFESCHCLTCHGFYAATLDLNRVRAMIDARPDGMLAVRTGAKSGIMVIDAESTADARSDDNLTGLDVVDAWEEWTGFALPVTLRQRTASGGLHLTYRIPPGVRVGSHNRVLPQVDVKAEGGYVAVPDGTNGRRWEPWEHQVARPVDAPAELLSWLQTRSGGTYRTGRSGSTGWRGQLLSDDEFKIALVEGARGGQREPFFAMLSFKLFKQGLSVAAVTQQLWEHFQRCEQPEHDPFHWSAIEYKIRRDAQTVRPDAPVSDLLQRWARQLTTQTDANSGGTDPATYRTIGYVTLRREP